MSQKLIPKRLRKAAFIFGGKHELQRKGLVLAVGFMRPLLVWRGYWIDEGYVMDDFFEVDGKRQEMASDATIRDFFAAKAMASASLALDKGEQELIANAAYMMADAMLKARNQ